MRTRTGTRTTAHASAMSRTSARTGARTQTSTGTRTSPGTGTTAVLQPCLLLLFLRSSLLLPFPVWTAVPIRGARICRHPSTKTISSDAILGTVL